MPRLRMFNKRKGKLSQSKKEYYQNQRIQESGLGDHTYFRKIPVEMGLESPMRNKNIEQNESDITETVIALPQEDCPYKKGSNKIDEKAELHEFSFISQEEYASINSHNLVHEQVEPTTVITGHRIVDLQYVLTWSMKIQVEHSKQCTMGTLEIIGEELVGLGCVILFKFELADKWKNSLWDSMQLAGREERRLAIENGRVDTEGVPRTTVYCDGGWSHRSYGHSYNSSSGVIQSNKIDEIEQKTIDQWDY
ncbi:hypothetical protein FQR65_LT17619 [Abscondita terminalis]|nr:hypothetical protein FQR65_LT17619 [Abscondita terminalis]